MGLSPSRHPLATSLRHCPSLRSAMMSAAFATLHSQTERQKQKPKAKAKAPAFSTSIRIQHEQYGSYDLVATEPLHEHAFWAAKHRARVYFSRKRKPLHEHRHSAQSPRSPGWRARAARSAHPIINSSPAVGRVFSTSSR